MPTDTLPTGIVTFLFSDIEESTPLWEKHSEAMRPALATHDELLSKAVMDHDGMVVKTTGDGIVAVFTSSSQAVLAAEWAQRELYKQAWTTIAPDRIRVRMGLHTGEVELRNGDYYGSTVNRAARLMSVAYGGQILLSRVTAGVIRDALPPDTLLRDLGQHYLRGLTSREHIFQVISPGLPHEFPPLHTPGPADGSVVARVNAFFSRVREENQVRALAIGLSVVGLMAVLAVVLAFNYAREARRSAELAAERELEAITNSQLATSRELSQAASNTLTVDPELSLLLALQALDQSGSREAEEALHRALQSIRTVSSFETAATGHFGSLLAVNADGTRVATAGNQYVTIWDTMSGATVRVLPLSDMTTEHYVLRYSDDGSNLILISADPQLSRLSLQEWAADSGQAVDSKTFPIALADSADVDLSRDRSLLAIGFEDSHVELWDVASQQPVLTIDEHNDSVVDTEFSASGELLETASRDGIIYLWDLKESIATGDPVLVESIEAGASTSGLGGLVHTQMIGDTGLALGYLGGIEVWDLADTARPRFTLQGDTKLSRDFSVSPDLDRLAAGNQAGTGQIWDLATGSHLLSLAQHPSPVDDLTFSPDGRRLITLDRDGLLRVWDTRLTNLGERTSVSVDPGVFDVAISPDEDYLAEGNVGGPASIWNLATGERLHQLPGDFGGVYRVAFSPDGQRLAGAGSDGKARVWNSLTGQLLLTLVGHQQGLAADLFPGVMDVTFSPDGTRLATAGADGVAIMWDAVTGEELRRLEGHTDSLLSLAWSPDGLTIATTSDDGDTSVKIWDAETGEELHSLLGHVVRAWGLAYSPDSQTLITGGARGIIKAWDIASGDNLYTVVDEADHIGSIAFAPDGEHYLSTGEVPLRIRRTSDGEEELTLAQPLIFSAQYSNDGRWIYGGNAEGVVPVFAVNLEDAVNLAEEKLTRWWRPVECLRYLHTETCPEAPQQILGGA